MACVAELRWRSQSQASSIRPHKAALHAPLQRPSLRLLLDPLGDMGQVYITRPRVTPSTPPPLSLRYVRRVMVPSPLNGHTGLLLGCGAWTRRYSYPPPPPSLLHSLISPPRSFSVSSSSSVCYFLFLLLLVLPALFLLLIFLHAFSCFFSFMFLLRLPSSSV